MTAQLDQTQLLDRAARLVEAAKNAGATDADALSLRRVSLSVEVRLGKVEETTRAEGDDVTLRVFVGRRNASVSANILTDPRELAERAVAMAKVAPEDPYAGLADPARLARSYPDLDLLDETVPDVGSLTDAATAAEEAARAVPGVSNSGGASAGWTLAGVVLATSGGFAGSYLTSRFSLSATAIAGEGTAMERDYDMAMKTHRADLPPPDRVGAEAAQRAVRRLNPGKMETTRAGVVYDPRIASSILNHLSGAVSGSAIARRTSFLAGSMGAEIFAPGIRIVDDPHRRRGLASRPFDGEGLLPEAFDLVTAGVLQRWLLDSAAARELKLESNARAVRSGGTPSPGASNLTLMPGTAKPADLLREVGNGLYVTDLIGAGVSAVTGDYSRGAAGFRIRDGELAEPVSEITIAGNLRDMFRNLRAADDLEYRFGVNAPTLAVEGMIIAGR